MILLVQSGLIDLKCFSRIYSSFFSIVQLDRSSSSLICDPIEKAVNEISVDV